MNFETNDDNALSRIISGFSGENEPHMIFINYILGSFLKCFYLFNQSVPWYDLFQCFICFCSLTGINYFLFKIIKSKYNIFLVLSFNIFVAYELYVKVQYTKTAGIASTAGLLILLLFTLFENRSILGVSVGILLSLIGFCYRANMFFVSLLICSSIGLYFFLNNIGIDKKVFWKKVVSCILSLFVLFCTLGMAYFVDCRAYSSYEWKVYFEKYNSFRTIYDYNHVDFDDEKIKENGLEIDDVEIKMLKRWTSGDTEIFSNDNLKKLSKSMEAPHNSLSDFIVSMVRNLLLRCYSPFLFFSFSVLILLIRNKIKFKHIIMLLYIGLSILIVYSYMYTIGRIFINRVDCIIWFSATIPVIMMINNCVKQYLKIHIIILLTIFILFQTLHYSKYRILNTDIQTKIENREVFDEISNDKEHLYLSTTFGLSFSEAYTIFDDIPLSGGENFTYLGGWTSYAPFETEKLSNYGIKNPYDDIIDNDLVYIIDEDIDNTIQYIRKHYNRNADAVVVKEVNKYKIYRIES